MTLASLSRRRLPALVLALGAAMVLVTSADAQDEAKLKVLGAQPVASAQPSCPANCEAVGKVTGYQILAAGQRNAYRVPANGRIVAWSLRLSQPSSSQVSFFNDFYGGTPRARLAVLEKAKGSVLRLAGQGPTEFLSTLMGEQPVFALDDPLRVKRGQYIGLTATTWIPAFATRLSAQDAWRASRRSDRCNNVKRNAAHVGTGSRRSYGCVYRTARLLYTAYFLPDAE